MVANAETVDSVGVILQRLFSTFANGWPGKGLLVLRFAISLHLLHGAFSRAGEAAMPLTQLLVALLIGCAGVLLLLGLWTPIAGAFAALVEAWNTFPPSGAAWEAALATAIALSLAFLGPGSYSIDAVKYGRKRISLDSD